MVFTRRDGRYSGTDIIKYPFKIIRSELGINARFYDLRGSFATTSLRNGCEINYSGGLNYGKNKKIIWWN